MSTTPTENEREAMRAVLARREAEAEAAHAEVERLRAEVLKLERENREMGRELERPLNTSELAAALGRSRGYIAAMRAAGLTGKTLASALAWLRANPNFTSTGHNQRCRTRSSI